LCTLVIDPAYLANGLMQALQAIVLIDRNQVIVEHLGDPACASLFDVDMQSEALGRTRRRNRHARDMPALDKAEPLDGSNVLPADEHLGGG
jgi:hypothetical protein